MKNARSLTLMILLMGIFGCKTKSELKTVPDVDLAKYSGVWYEIASFPIGPQRGCSCTTAEYTVMPEGYVKVYNRCLKNGVVSDITGKAFAVKGSNNTKLKVQFFWPFRADYWIIDLAPDYSYAVVGHPGRNYLWILSRTPKMDDSLYSEITNRIAAQGYDLSRLQKTVQVNGDTLK